MWRIHKNQWANEKHSGNSDGDTILIRKNNFFLLRAKREREGQYCSGPSGGRFTEFCKLERQTGAHRKETRLVLYSMMHREARLSPTLCGYYDDRRRARTRLAPGPRRSQTFRLSAARAPSAVSHVEVPQYCKLDKHREYHSKLGVGV